MGSCDRGLLICCGRRDAIRKCGCLLSGRVDGSSAKYNDRNIYTAAKRDSHDPTLFSLETGMSAANNGIMLPVESHQRVAGAFKICLAEIRIFRI